MTDPRTPIAVFRMAGVKPHVQRKRLVLWLRFDEVDSAIDDDFRFVPQAAIGLFLVKRISANRFELVEMIRLPIPLRHLRMPLAEVAGSVAVLPQHVRVQSRHGIRSGLITIPDDSEAASSHARQDRGAAHPADRMTDERVVETGPSLSQRVNVRSLHDIVAVAAERACGLIIGEEENDVRLRRRDVRRKPKNQQRQNDKNSIHGVISFRKQTFEISRPATRAGS